MNDHHHPLYGVLLILLSGLLLASHDGLAKHLSEIYPVFLVIWARYVAQTVLMTALFVPPMLREPPGLGQACCQPSAANA